tara:strand:- start:868 stop:1086 length:219 start_codon:yes stop_codon:yes gene_type:complete
MCIEQDIASHNHGMMGTMIIICKAHKAALYAESEKRSETKSNTSFSSTMAGLTVRDCPKYVLVPVKYEDCGW